MTQNVIENHPGYQLPCGKCGKLTDEDDLEPIWIDPNWDENGTEEKTVLVCLMCGYLNKFRR